MEFDPPGAGQPRENAGVVLKADGGAGTFVQTLLRPRALDPASTERRRCDAVELLGPGADERIP